MDNIFIKEHENLPKLFCPRCSREMKIKIKEYKDRDLVSGLIIKKMARYICPNFLCMLTTFLFSPLYSFPKIIAKQNNKKWRLEDITDYECM